MARWRCRRQCWNGSTVLLNRPGRHQYVNASSSVQALAGAGTVAPAGATLTHGSWRQRQQLPDGTINGRAARSGSLILGGSTFTGGTTWIWRC
jgi:hypothetical protein